MRLPVQQRSRLPYCIMPATPKHIHLHADSCSLQCQLPLLRRRWRR